MNARPSVDVIGSPASLGESPLWHPLQQQLFWVDIEGKSVHRLDPATGKLSGHSLPGRPGSMALTTDGDVVLLAMEHQLVWLTWSSGRLEPWIDLEASGLGVRLNDGRVDPAGRFVVGSMFENPEAGRFEGSLHQVEADGTSTTLRRGVGVANGNAFDLVNERAYFADSPTGNVWTWDYDAASGERGNERLLFDYQSVPGVPDGATTDSDGCYWSASVFGWALIRLTPDGRVDRRIEVPLERPTMPCFGGPGLDTLYVTSIGGSNFSEPPDGIVAVEPGSMIAMDVGVSGVPEPLLAAPST